MQHLDKYIVPNRRLSPQLKKFLLISLIVLICLVIVLILVFLPFKNNRSTYDWLVDKFYRDNWDSAEIMQAIIYVLTIILIIWNVAIRVADTILYRKKLRLYHREMLDKGYSPYEKTERRAMIFSAKEKKKYVDTTFDKILAACDAIGKQITGVAAFEIREILDGEINGKFNAQTRKTKIAKISKILTDNGCNINNQVLAKVLKQI